MVLISITSDPGDFLSAPPPGVFRRRSIIKPVSFTSNGKVCKEHDLTKKRKNSLQILLPIKEGPKLGASEPTSSEAKESDYEDLESKLLSIYVDKTEKVAGGDERNNEGITVLMAACQQGLEHDVRTILRRKPSLVRQTDRTGKTALHYCAENQSTACCHQLLDLQPGLVNTQDNEGYTPLILAVLAGNTNIIRYLLSRNAKIDAVDCEHHSAVHWAVVCGELEPLDVLCNAGAEINSPDIHGAFPLHYAAQMCGPSADQPEKSRIFLVVLRKLLARGADPSVLDKDLRPPILWAASAGSADAFLALVNYGASPANIDADGLSALHCAASRGHRECLSVLSVLTDINVNMTDHNGCTSLFYTVTLGYVECTELLLECGAQTDLRDRKGRTAVHCGAAKGQLETLKVLRKYNAEMWSVNNKGETPLHLAVRSGRRDLISWLLHLNPACVDQASLEGRTALHVAAATNNPEICSILLDWKADINKTLMAGTGRGKPTTPLDVALLRASKSCARFLQSRGALRASKLIKRSSAETRDSSVGPEINKESRNSDSEIGIEESAPVEKSCRSDLKETERKCPVLSPRFTKSPFQPPPRTMVDMSAVAEEDREEDSSENINDENVGKKIMISRLLEEQHSASFLRGKNSRGQSSEFTKLSVPDCSGNFESKDISEIYKLNGTLKFPKTSSVNTGKLSSKELRRLRQKKFYLDELGILRDNLTRLKAINCNPGLIVKRLIDNFNRKILHYVGCRTYTGPISATYYEKYLLSELCRLCSVSHPADLYLETEVQHISFSNITKLSYPGDRTRSRSRRLSRSINSQRSYTDSSTDRRLVLPNINNPNTTGNSSSSSSTTSERILEVRHGGVRKQIKLPQYNSQSEQQISVSFKIQPKVKSGL